VAEWQTQRIQNPPPSGREGSSPSFGTVVMTKAPRATFAIGFFLALLAHCNKDQAKESASRAAEDVAELVDLVGKDLGEVERGLPEGAKRLAPLVANGADPKQDVAGVRRALLHMRREVADLNVAKSTFFALADSSGMAIRNDLEEDVMAGQNLFPIFPELARSTAGYIATTGAFPNATTKNGPDKDWVAAVPVKRENGTAGALLVTGWTYRYFARHLQESLKDRLVERIKRGTSEKLPVFYVGVFDKSGVYCAPLTPQVDEQALAAQDMPSKTQQPGNGAYMGTLNITDRAFGFAAQRTPMLAPDTGVVVLRSEL
jgi:hypothetical protein